FREYCLSKSRTTEGTPFGPDVVVFKVGGKMFALASLDNVPTTVNLKCDPDLALELRDRYEQVRPGYHMNKKHWNTVEIEGGIPDFELRKMIDHSYQLVIERLPKPKVKIAARSRRSSVAARHARLLTRTLLSVARNAFSYAPLRIVARVPITPTCWLRVVCNAARAPGSITPITGTGNFLVSRGSATDETVLHATTSAFAFFCISICASSSA